jgi:F-type H+-transporting ATPase subunit delta
VRSREIAERYAGALYEVAVERGAVPAVAEEMKTLVDEVYEVKDLVRFLTHPLISRERKTELVGAAFPDLSPSVANMVGLLIRNRREGYLDLIYDAFLEAQAAAEQLARVRVVTAAPLTDEDRRRLKERLERALGQAVSLEEDLAGELLAGARIEVQGRTVDASVRARLARLRDALER